MAGMERPLRTRILPILLLVALASGLATASAQGNWFGVRSGYPLGVTLHYGIANALSNGYDLRVSGKLVVDNAGSRFGLGLDAMHTFAAASPFSAYLGAGPSMEFGSGTALLDLHALLGGEFRFTDFGLPQLGLFAEGTLGATIGISNAASRFPTFGAALGVNWHF